MGEAEYEIELIRRLTKRVRELQAERDRWKANHDEQVRQKRALLDRPDLADRAKSIQQLTARLEQAEAERDRLKEAARKTLALTDYTLEEHGVMVPDGIVPDKYVMGRAAYDAINEAIDAARKAMGDEL